MGRAQGAGRSPKPSPQGSSPWRPAKFGINKYFYNLMRVRYVYWTS